MSDIAEVDVQEDPETNNLREGLAALAHEQWSGWMRYMLRDCDGGACPAVRGATGEAPRPLIDHTEYRMRWQRQMETPYADLSEDERKSDRAEADRVLAVLAEAELRCVAAEMAKIRALVESSDSYVPQDVAAQCMLILSPLDEPGKPNTLIALVERAMATIKERDAELDRLCGPVCPYDDKRAVEHTYLLCKFGEENHAPWPAGAEWLAKRNVR